MQMLPYLELPLYLPAMDDTPAKVVTGKFIPMPLPVLYHEISDNQTIVYLQSGQPFIAQLSVADYEAKITAYYKLISQTAKPINGNRIHKV
jgi:hypothetical protein